MLKLLIAISLHFSCALANSAGPPIQQGDGNNLCVSLTPNHGETAQPDAPPYTIGFMDGVSTYTFDTPVQVTVSGTDGEQFRGVLCQARSGEETAPLGTFTEDHDQLQVKQCNEMDNTITHMNAAPNTMDLDSVSFTWHPPMGEMREVKIICTVVRTQSDYWVAFPSSEALTWMNDTMMAEGEPSTAAMPDGQDPVTMETTTAAANSLVAGSFFSLLICMLLAKTF